jgi:NADH dehydrogenase [ubiquinone] 1 alpha subcomplex assembly factor 6
MLKDNAAPMPPTPTYIADLVRKDDHDRFLTAIFAPQPARDGVLALYAFNVEVAKVRESVTENIIGQMKLQWWRDVVTAIYEGGNVPQGNPVVEGLAATIRTYNLSRDCFETLLDARARDMADESPADVNALEAYADGTSASLSNLILEVLGVRDETSRAAARHVGIAWALTGLLRAVLFHARINRFLLPQDLLAAENLSAHDLQEKRNADRIGVVIAQIARIAAAHLDKARTYRKNVDKRALPVLLPATLADQYLKGLARRNYDVFDPRHVLQRPAMLRLTWNAWRGTY